MRAYVVLTISRDLPSICPSTNHSDASPAASAELLAEQGLFERRWPEFTPRPGQQAMAALIERAFTEQRSLVIEAPSGSGKTLAYLVPLILLQRRAIISTASRYLQHQLYRHDIPRALGLLQAGRTVALLQGRSHYLCPYYLDKHRQGGVVLARRTQAQLAVIARRYHHTGNGELAVLAPALSPQLRPLVTSSADTCLGRQCPKWSQCPLMIARQRAQRADLVVVNHSLLFADRWQGSDPLGALLPERDTVVVDEAHRLADFAQTQMGSRLTSARLKAYLLELKQTIALFAPEQVSLTASITQLEQGLAALGTQLPAMEHYRPEQYATLVTQLMARLERIQRHLRHLQQRHQQLQEMLIRVQHLVDTLSQIADQNELCRIQSVANGFVIQAIPGLLAPPFKQLFSETPASWVFTSATLSVSASPQRFLSTLGLDSSLYHRLSSDFDHRQQARLFTPRLPVEPDHPAYSRHLLAEAVPLIQRAGGRVLFLFSSHRALAAVAPQLKGLVDCPVLWQKGKQTDRQRGHARLLAAFRQAPLAVLLGTGSFWEGIDLSGVPLSAVIIDKLPFALPGDPLVQLRCRELTRHGVDSFAHYLLPEAVIRLRQGCGRLLRRRSDRGVIMIADPRLHSKAYGRAFIDSLPAMERVMTMDELSPFFTEPCVALATGSATDTSEME